MLPGIMVGLLWGNSLVDKVSFERFQGGGLDIRVSGRYAKTGLFLTEEQVTYMDWDTASALAQDILYRLANWPQGGTDGA